MYSRQLFCLQYTRKCIYARAVADEQTRNITELQNITMEQRKRKEYHLSEGCSDQLASEEREEERNTQTKKQKKQTNKQIKGTDKQTNKKNIETNKYCNEKKKITSARVAAAN